MRTLSKTIKLLFCWLCPALMGFGQDTTQARLITIIPIHVLTGGVIIVKATVNDHPDSLHFILDTGSGGISLDSTTCEQLGIQPTASDRTIKGIGGVRPISYVFNATLHLNQTLHVDSLNFHVNDYDILSSVYGLKIDGIIGYSFLSRYIVKLDYDSQQMLVYTQGKISYPKGGFKLKPYMGIIPVLPTTYVDAKQASPLFYFDTGAGLCFLLTKAYVNDSSVFRKKKAPMVFTQAEGVGGKTQMGLTTVKQLKIGPYRFRNVPTYVFDDPFNIIPYPQLAGLVGNDILRRFNIFLNYRKREFYLVPNQHLREAFDYSYTGLGMYVVDGKVTIEDVIPGSPGDQAGFKNGDVVLGISKNFSNNILEYKNLLQNTTGKIKMIIIREGVIMEMNIRPKNIMKRR